MQDEIAARIQAVTGPPREGAAEGLHGKIVAHQQAGKADASANDLFDHHRRDRGRPGGVDGGVDDVSGHGHRRVGEIPERLEVDGFQVGQVGRHHRETKMTVGGGSSMARDVLDHRDDGAGHQALCGDARQQGDLVRALPVGAVSDDVMGAGRRDIQHGRTVDCDPQVMEVMGDKARAEPGHLAGQRRIIARQVGEGPRRRVAAPVRRPKTGHPAALLVDEHRRIGPANAGAKRRDHGPHLIGRDDVAAEKYETPGLGLAEEGRLGVSERRPGAAEDGRAGHRTKQALPAATSLAHTAWACSRVSKPVMAVR